MKKSYFQRAIAMTLLGCLVMGGCGTQGAVSGNKADPTTIMIWHYYNGKQKDAFDQLVNEFNDTVGAEKGIVVSAESKGVVEELATAITDSAEEKVGSDKLPDIFATYADTALVIDEMGLLTDIGQYMTEDELAEYVPGFLEEGYLMDDELKVLPVAKSTELFYLNETDWEPFAEATGASEASFDTWEGLAEVAEQYYNWSGGKAFFGRDAFANYLIVGSKQLGAPVFDVKDNEVNIQMDETAMRRLWDCYAVPYLKGYYGAYGSFRSDDMKTGDLIACIGSTSSVTYLPSEVTKTDGSTYPIDIKVFDLPDFEGTDAYAVQQGAGMAVIHSDEVKEAAAVEFLKWLTDVEQNTKFSVGSGYSPVKTEANQIDNIKKELVASGAEEGSLFYENLMMGAQSIKESNLYTSKAFDGGTEARAIVTRYMSEKLNTYKEELQTMIDGGTPKEEAWDSYITDELFQSWVTGLQSELTSAT